MDLLAFIIGELLPFLAEKAVRGIKNEKMQVFAAATFTFVTFVSLVGFATWKGISFYRDGNIFATIFCGTLIVLAILLIGSLIRRIIRRRKSTNSKDF